MLASCGSKVQVFSQDYLVRLFRFLCAVYRTMSTENIDNNVGLNVTNEIVQFTSSSGQNLHSSQMSELIVRSAVQYVTRQDILRELSNISSGFDDFQRAFVSALTQPSQQSNQAQRSSGSYQGIVSGSSGQRSVQGQQTFQGQSSVAAPGQPVSQGQITGTVPLSSAVCTSTKFKFVFDSTEFARSEFWCCFHPELCSTLEFRKRSPGSASLVRLKIQIRFLVVSKAAGFPPNQIEKDSSGVVSSQQFPRFLNNGIVPVQQSGQSQNLNLVYGHQKSHDRNKGFRFRPNKICRTLFQILALAYRMFILFTVKLSL